MNEILFTFNDKHIFRLNIFFSNELGKSLKDAGVTYTEK